jgi:hypothetical protein
VNPQEEFTYLVDHIGQWVLANAEEARQYSSLGFHVFSSDSFIEVTEWTHPRPAVATSNAFARQIDEVHTFEDAHIEEAEARYKEETPKKKGKFRLLFVCH